MAFDPSNPATKIAIVFSSSTVRQGVSSCLKGLNFAEVTSFSSLKDIKPLIIHNTVDWIICALDTAKDYNAISCLKDLVKKAPRWQARLSVFIGKDERRNLIELFSLGALSWHDENFNKDSLKSDFSALIGNFTRYQNDSIRVSAHYLRTFLISQKEGKLAADLDSSLIARYPTSPEYLVNLGEDYLVQGDEANAFTYFKQAKFINKDLGSKIDEILKTYKINNIPDKMATTSGVSSVKSCLVIDPDETILVQVSDFLTELGVANITTFGDSAEAWKWLESHPEPDLILHEWRLTKMSSVQLIQRLRSSGRNKAIVIVVSSLVTKKDLPLLREMSVASLVSKPINKKEFLLAISWNLSQDQLPTQQKSLERKMLSHLASHEVSEAEKLMPLYLADQKISEPAKSHMKAQIYYHKGNYTLARDFAIKSIKEGGKESLSVINLLGKTLMKLDDHSGALQCFKKAQDLSPQNISRMCDIATSLLMQGSGDLAQEQIQAARKIDPKNKDLLKIEVVSAINHNEIDKAVDLMKDDSINRDIVAALNNQAVSLIKTGNIDKALKLYQSTVEAMPAGALKAIVQYNFALARIRQGKQNLALALLVECLKVEDSKVFRKAKSMRAKIKKAQVQGKAYTIVDDIDIDIDLSGLEEGIGTDEDITLSPKIGFDDIINSAKVSESTSGPSPGEFCLYKIFMAA